jgi:phosphoenolpyruvate carboxykinase (ATP)
MQLLERLDALLAKRGSAVRRNPGREEMIQASLDNREAMLLRSGALATWTRPESSGRSPRDTVIVKRPESSDSIDWTSPNNLPLLPDTFDMVWEDGIETLEKAPEIFVTERVAGADSRYALPVRVVTSKALTGLFTDNMFRPVPEDIESSVFCSRHFTLVVLPDHKLDPGKYRGRLRDDPATGGASTMIVAMDMDRMLGIVYGSAYCGSVKKLVFTVMNYLLPPEGVLPMHCSANEGVKGDCALMLGLSGTGKTTLSADPSRALLGDDEHGWSREGIANFEYGCYAKLVDLSALKEPDIYNACFHEDDYLRHGAIVENVMAYPDGGIDLFDKRLTENSRGSYPLGFLPNIKKSSTSRHPETMVFLTADANGVLPPIAKLTRTQAMFWFLMGYTSKLAGTETGIVEPVSTFSRFFGGPFMPRKPEVYAGMLGEKLDEHRTRAFLLNTGWSGGPYGEGKRISLPLTRTMLNAALHGELESVPCVPDPYFNILVPETCPGLPDDSILFPVNTWGNPEAYRERAEKLAGEFAHHFRKAYGSSDLDESIIRECPGIQEKVTPCIS